MVQALLDPSRYPHPADRVELMETHGAWVLLAGEHAYKIKKPVQLPFMDFSTLERRRAACEAEIRVNRRFAPEGDEQARIYLACLPITGSPTAPRWGQPGDAAPAIEYAVHMRRFAEAGRLDHLCRRGGLTPGHLGRLAQDIAAFQAGAAVAKPQDPWGRSEDVIGFARDNLDTLRSFLEQGGGLPLQRLQRLAAWTEAEFARIRPLLERRRCEGRVREGHGDLHLANLVLIGGQVLPFDAIEFNDSLRWIDVASDVAFTWMDLLHSSPPDQPGLAHVWLSEWLDASADVQAPDVLPFFAAYRALVRAKVACIRGSQAGADAAACRSQASGYMDLALRIAQAPAPSLVITHGLSGSGKTWASGRWLVARGGTRVIRLRSDVERKRLHGLAALQASGSGLNAGLYSAQAHGHTYGALRERAAGLLAAGWTVLVDAAFLRHPERTAFAELARAQACPFHILACEAPLPVLRQRISERQARGQDASEATLDVLEQQLGWLQPLAPEERALTLAPI